MSKSKVVQIIVGPKRRRGKTGRNAGTGVRKLSRSKWRSYAAMIENQKLRRILNMERRFCKECNIQFHSRGVYLRHVRKEHGKNFQK